MRKIGPWLLTIAGCLLVTGALASVKYQQIAAAIAFGASFPEPYEVVNAERVSAVTYRPTRRLAGTVRRPEFVEISPEVGGRIVALPFAAGALVKAGQPVVKLFSDDLVAQRQALNAERTLTITQLDRSRQLFKQALIAQDDIDILEARLEALTAQIAGVQAQLTRLTIKAPFDGRLGIYSQVVGERVDGGDKIADFTGMGDTRWVDFKVPQGLARLVVGDTVSLYDIDGRFRVKARVIVVSETIDAQTRTFSVRAETDNAGLKHGELIQVELESGTPANVYQLPPASIRWDTQGTYIVELTESEAGTEQPFRAKLTRVELIDEFADVALFTAALDDSALFATTGSFKLTEGELARLYDGVK